MSINADDEKPVTEMEEPFTYAPSIPVANVQEMVKKNPLEVPERYIRSPEEIEKDKYMSHLSSKIPVIDLALLSCGNSDELLKLDMACKDWGFFQLVNHGVNTEVFQRTKNAAAEFLNLPIEEKDKYAMPLDDLQGYGHAYVVSDDQKLDWYDALNMLIYPTRFRKPEFWPQTPKDFKEIIEAYAREINRVGEELLGSLSVIMGLQKNALLGLHKELFQSFLVNYYPPCSSPEKVVGLSPHSDTDTITLLMQDDQVFGLEVRHKGGWVPIAPIPDALVVNIGDVLEIWSNGRYKSVEHRAMTNKNKGRTSYVSFFFPRADVEVEPLDKMIDVQNPKLYKKVIYGEYMRQTFKKKMDGKAQAIDAAKIN